jgi:hypothetical protein
VTKLIGAFHIDLYVPTASAITVRFFTKLECVDQFRSFVLQLSREAGTVPLQQVDVVALKTGSTEVQKQRTKVG